MNLAQLRALLAVSEHGSFSVAAARLGLTQSGVSHAVASLERELGLRLLTRDRGGVASTATGEQVLLHAREALRQVERIAEVSAAARGQYRGRLRLAGFPSAAQLLPPYIAAFNRRFPDVEVVLLEGTDSEVGDWLDAGFADLAVRTDADDGVLLAEDWMMAVLDRDHPLAGEQAVALPDLADDPFLLSDGGCEPLLRAMYTAASVEFRPAQRVRDMATLLALVREQLGVTIVPELALTDLRGLVTIPVTPRVRRRLVLTAVDPTHVGPIAQSFLHVAAANGGVAGEERVRRTRRRRRGPTPTTIGD